MTAKLNKQKKFLLNVLSCSILFSMQNGYAMQAMNERNLTVSQMGRSTFSVLLFQDIAAIPLVAMIPLLAASGASTTLQRPPLLPQHTKTILVK